MFKHIIYPWMIALGMLFILGASFGLAHGPVQSVRAETIGSVVRTVEDQVCPGRSVVVVITPKDFDLFYAVKEDFGGLAMTGHTADNYQEETFIMNTAQRFGYKLFIPEDAQIGARYTITGQFWNDPDDKRDIVTPLTLTVTPCDVSKKSPMAWVRGFLNPQPDHINRGYLVAAAEVSVAPWYDSKVKDFGFILEGNSNATALLFRHLPDKKKVLVGFKNLGGQQELFLLEQWVEVKGETLNDFSLQILYRGKCGQGVPKVRVKLALENVKVYADSHGGYQDVLVSKESPPIPPTGPDIKILCPKKKK